MWRCSAQIAAEAGEVQQAHLCFCIQALPLQCHHLLLQPLSTVLQAINVGCLSSLCLAVGLGLPMVCQLVCGLCQLSLLQVYSWGGDQRVGMKTCSWQLGGEGDAFE